MLDFCSDREIVVSQSMRAHLQVFGSIGNKGIDSLIIFSEGSKSVTELSGSFSLVDFNFASESLKLIDVLGSSFLLNCHQPQVECLLISFLQECHKEL